MKLVWALPARRDFERAIFYIEQENPPAARRFTRAIRNGVAHLKEFPQLGKPGIYEHTREFHIAGTSYYCAYRVNDHMIEIIRLLHHKQLWI